MYKSRPMSVLVTQTTANQVQTIPSSVYDKLSWIDEFSGVENPHWRQAVAMHQSATSVAAGRRRTVVHKDGTQFIAGTTGEPGPSGERMAFKSGWLTYTDFSGGFANSAADGSAQTEADSKFYSESRSAFHALQGGELLGELAKTAQMIIGITSKMKGVTNHALDRFKRFRGKRFSQHTKAVADIYLEWKFGWNPLCNDIKALANDLKDDNQEFVKLKCTGKSRGSRTYVLGTGTVGGLAHYDITVKMIDEYLVRYIWELGVTRQGTSGFLNRLGLAPNNFASTIYNLLPWTYMIDYFTNLGDMIESIGFPRSSIRWVNHTIRNNCVTTLYAGGLKPTVELDGVQTIDIPQITTITDTAFRRDTYVPPPMPGFKFRLPGFSNESGRNKWLNVAAVLAQQSVARGIFRS